MAPSATRRRRLHLVAPVLAAALLLAACGDDDGTVPATPTDDGTVPAATTDGGDPTQPATSAPPSGPTTGPVTESPSEAGTGAGTEAEAPTPALDLTATTPDGSTLTLADYAGRPMFIETFATWCSNCRAQLGDTQEAAAMAGENAVFLALSVETDLDPARLDDYATDNGFEDLTFAVLSDESLAVLEGRFGNSVLVPPSTPKFTVAADGTVSELTTGFESVEEILGQLDHPG